MTALKFSKGGKAKSPVRTPDTMVSTDTVEVLLGISEGPIKGLENGARSFMADDTPLENTSGEANFQNFELDVWPGTEAGHVVTLDLGGFSNPKTIGVTLAKDVPVVRAGQTAGIDAVDFRIVVAQLLKQTDEGVFTNRMTLKFEVKKTTDAAWTLAWFNAPSTTNPGGAVGGGSGDGGGGGYTAGGHHLSDERRTVINFNGPGIDMGDRTTYRSYGRVNDLLTFDGDIQTALVAGVPTAPPANPDLPAVAVNTVTNGVYHWASGSWTVDTPTTETGYKVLNDGRRLYDQSDTPPSGARTGDLWLKMQLGVLQIILVWNGGAWVKPSEYQAEAPTTPADGIWDTYAKVSSATPKDIRVFLPNPQPGDMWEYRVTKLSNDTGTEEFSEIQWESVQEISRTPMAFNGVAMARVIGRASDQFTALPQWTGDWMGRIVKVASNYDPIAKTYTGIWDGLYKIEWTDNNAWIFQDFVENDRYGLSSIFPHTVNKWKIYEFAQHCDVKVLRPDGSLRPRWTYNDYIQEPRDAKELASYIAGSAGARYVDDGNGVVEVVIDKDDPAIAIFTPENIGEDGFSYSYSDRLTRANEVTVEFVNPTLNWQRDKRIVRDDADIALYGRIPENFIAVGCTDVDEALARARRRLIGGLTEKEIATFTTNRKGRFLAEWSVILLGDPEMGRGITGRIRAVTGARSVSLRDPLAFEPGITYWASFDIVNPDYPATSSEPFKLERRQIANSAGADQTTLTFASDLPALPEYATFILEAPDVAGFPKPYRVTNIGDDSGTGDQIRITCLELNRNKWAYIDTGEGEGDLIYSDFSSKIVLPPVNPTLVVTTRARGTGATRAIEVRWDKSPSRWVRRYKVYHAVDGVPQKAIDATTTSIEIEGAESGTHTFAIVAIDIRGRESLPLTLTYNVTGDARPVAPPTNLTLVGGLLPTVFEDLSPKVTWDAPPASPNFKNYRLVISDTSSGAQLRIVELATELEYRYDFLMNRDDGLGTATRDLTFTLYAVDQDNNLSPPVELSINNPAPFAPTITVTATMGGINVVLSPSTERDVVGAKLSVSTVSGVTAVAQDANQGSFFVPLADGDLRYIKAAYYDKFSSSDLFWSAESSVTRGGIADVDLPATVPATVSGTPTLSFSSTINPDGTQVTTLTAGWTAVSAATGYDIEINDGVTPWTEWSPVASIKNLRVQPGRTYTVKVKAVGRTGLRSAAWSTTSAATAAGGDVTGPGNISSPSLTALARRIVLSWTNPADPDYDGLDIYRNTTNSLPGTPFARRVRGNVFTDTDVIAGTLYYYWGITRDRTGNSGGSTISLGSATPAYVTVAGGDVLSTDPTLVTSQGVAASFTGQTAWATYGTLTPTTVQGRVGNLDGSGNLTSLSNINTRSLSLLTGRTADQLTYVTGGATVESLRPGEAGANVTETRTASAITGQTSWATYGTYTPAQVATPVNTFLTPRTQSSSVVAAGGARWHRVARVVSSVGRGAMRVTLGFNGGGATPSALVLDVSRDWDVNGTISIVSNGTGCPITQARLSRGTGESYLDVYIGANSAFDMMISVEPMPGTEGVWAVNYVDTPTVGATLIGTIPLTDVSGANRVLGVMTNGTYTLVSAAGGVNTNGVAAVNASGVSYDVTHGADRAVLERGANITETRTASAITGQTDWATYTGRSVGALNTAIFADGYLQSGLNTHFRPDMMVNGAGGTQLARDPEFQQAWPPAQCGIYNNGGGTKVTAARVADNTAPNASGYKLTISYDGTGTPGSNPSPGFGGIFCLLDYAGDGNPSRPGYYAKNTKILYKIWANIPVGRTLETAANSYGTEGTSTWLTSQAGTGGWALYEVVYVIGLTGAFSTIGHLYVAGGSNTAFSWSLAKYEQVDLTSVANGFTGNLRRVSNGAVLGDATVVTGDGTAAAIAGQTAWATYGTLTPTTVQGRVGNLDASGNLTSLSNITTRPLDALTGRTADKVNYIGGGGVTMEVLRPQEANANVTETRTASAITGQGPGATAVSNRVLNDRYEGGVKLIQQPDGGQFNVSSANQVGQLEIVFPFAWNAVSPMITFDVVVHDYSTGRTSTYTVAGHHYSTGSNGWWANVTATFNGPRAFSRPVKFGFNAAGKPTVWIGSVGDLWQYPNVTIRNVQIGYASQANDWATGWSISLNNTAISGSYVNMTTPYWVHVVGVPRSGDQVFGEGLLEVAGGAVATRPNFRTDQGVAASISGQAATATSSDFAAVTGATRPANNATVGADWTTNLTNRAPVTQGGSLTEDPSGADPSAWTGVAGSFVSITDGEVATTAMRLTGGTLLGARRVPVDAAKTYMIECWMRRTGTTNTAYGLVSLRDGAGSEINGDGSYWLYHPSNDTIPTAWTYYSRVFGAGTGKTIPANAVTMCVGALPNYNAAAGAVEIQGLRIVEVTRIGGSLYMPNGNLATQGDVVTASGTAAAIAGQSVLATNPDFAGVTGATRPSDNAGTSGTLTALGSHSTVRGNFVQKSNVTGTHGAWQGGAAGPPQRGSCFISGSVISAGMGHGWLTCYALGEDATSFVDTSQRYRMIVSDSAVGAGSIYLQHPGGQTSTVSVPSLSPASRAMLAYDGSTVKAIVDGIVYHSVDAPPGLRLWPKMLDYYVSQSSVFPSGVVDIQHGTWTENTVSTVTLIPYNTETTVSGSTATKTGGSNGSWGAGVSSREKYAGAAFCSFRIGTSAQPYVMAGLVNSSFGGTYATLNYCLFVESTSSNVAVYENGSFVATVVGGGSWALTDVWSIVYDGVRVQYLQNGIVRHTSAAAAGQVLGFAASQVYIGNNLTDIQVGPANQVARVGQNTYDDSGGTLVARGGLITSLGTAASISGQTAAATAPDVQVFNDRKQGNVTHIALPVGGTNENSGSADMGAWRIVLPVTWNYAMISFEVEVQRYGGGGAVVYQIYGYTYDYGGGSHGWINSSVKATGDRFGFQNVYMHKDPATGRPAVDIGLVNSTTWPYSKVSVKNVRVGHTPGTVADWDDGWTVTLTNAARGADSYTIGAGSIGQDAVFGENCWETEAKATLATRANFRTDQGVASSYAGQTLLATQTFPTHAGVAAAKAAGLTDGRQFYDSTNSNLLTAVTSAAGGFGATASHTNRSGSRFGAGSVTTSTVTVTPTGAGGSVSYSWYRISGDTGISATSSTGAATAFTGSVGVGETKSATFACAATDAGTGKTVTLLVTASITETT